MVDLTGCFMCRIESDSPEHLNLDSNSLSLQLMNQTSSMSKHIHEVYVSYISLLQGDSLSPTSVTLSHRYDGILVVAPSHTALPLCFPISRPPFGLPGPNDDLTAGCRPAARRPGGLLRARRGARVEYDARIQQDLSLLDARQLLRRGKEQVQQQGWRAVLGHSHLQ